MSKSEQASPLQQQDLSDIARANISASLPMRDLAWLLRQCEARGLSRSAMLADLVRQARVADEQKRSLPVDSSSDSLVP